MDGYTAMWWAHFSSVIIADAVSMLCVCWNAYARIWFYPHEIVVALDIRVDTIVMGTLEQDKPL